jgi:hypothetical protein
VGSILLSPMVSEICMQSILTTSGNHGSQPRIWSKPRTSTSDLNRIIFCEKKKVIHSGSNIPVRGTLWNNSVDVSFRTKIRTHTSSRFSSILATDHVQSRCPIHRTEIELSMSASTMWKCDSTFSSPSRLGPVARVKQTQ